MTKYVMTFHGEFDGEMPSDPKEMEQVMAAWGAWYGTMGESLVDGGNPFSVQAAIGPDGADVAPPGSLTGYTIVDVASIDAAKTIAKGCPVLEGGGTVQISECLEMG